MTEKKTGDLFFKKKFLLKLDEYKTKLKEEGKDYSDDAIAQIIGCSRQSIANWKNGKRPDAYNLSLICETFGASESDFELSSKEDLYQFQKEYINKVGRDRYNFANEIGFDLNLLSVLKNIITDFDESFPLYSNIIPEKNDSTRYIRNPNFVDIKTAIDDDLRDLQIHKGEKTITMHDIDLLFLKEVQDQIINFVEYLFYKRSKEMEDEVEKFNADINSPIVTLNGVPLEKTVQEKYLQIINNPKFNIPNDEYTDQLREELTEEIKKIGIDTSGTIDLIYPEVTEEFILQHDRFAKYFDVILPKKKKATQKDIDSYFKKEGK